MPTTSAGTSPKRDTALRIIELVEADRQARASCAEVHRLLSDLTAHACAGRWLAACDAAQALQSLFYDLEAAGQPGFDSHLLPNPSMETVLMNGWAALGYREQNVEQLRAAVEGGDSEEERRDRIRDELRAYGVRKAGRDDLLLSAVGSGISVLETARLSRVARGTVHAVLSKADTEDSTMTTTAAAQPEAIPAPRPSPIHPALFLAPHAVSQPDPLS